MKNIRNFTSRAKSLLLFRNNPNYPSQSTYASFLRMEKYLLSLENKVYNDFGIKIYRACYKATSSINELKKWLIDASATDILIIANDKAGGQKYFHHFISSKIDTNNVEDIIRLLDFPNREEAYNFFAKIFQEHKNKPLVGTPITDYQWETNYNTFIVFKSKTGLAAASILIDIIRYIADSRGNIEFTDLDYFFSKKRLEAAAQEQRAISFADFKEFHLEKMRNNHFKNERTIVVNDYDH